MGGEGKSIGEGKSGVVDIKLPNLVLIYEMIRDFVG